jgi:DNA-binding CsgD family transcriptional regulator
MKNVINKHPSLILNSEIQDICKPLKQLNINYFCEVIITNQKEFSAIGTSAGFTEHYLKNKYYNVDLHTAKNKNLENFVIWDMIERRGMSAKMHQEAAAFGLQHTFTIIENTHQGRHYYHFGNSGSSLAINQVYLANLDLLKKFTHYFKESINQSKALAAAHEIKFKIAPNAEGYLTTPNFNEIGESSNEQFISTIFSPKEALENNLILVNKHTNQPIKLTIQQSKCIQHLARGHSNKQIAKLLDLSPRTVENYLNRVRIILNCDSSKELISLYLSR